MLAYTLVNLNVTLSLQGGDDDGQDPQGECEAGQRQVQDLEGGEERQHEKESGPVREHVSQGQEGWRHMPEFQKLLTVTNFDPKKLLSLSDRMSECCGYE